MAVSDPRQKRLEVLIGVVGRIEEGGIDLDAVGWLGNTVLFARRGLRP